MKTIFLLVGESSCGKDSLANKLEQDGYKVLKSYATRPRRDNEGDTHIFITPEEVSQYKDNIVAYTKIGKYEYFSTSDQLYDNDIYIIDPNGVEYLKSKMCDINIVAIYINVDKSIRLYRALTLRKDNLKAVEERFNSEKKMFDEFKLNARFDYSIPNKDLEKSYEILKNIIEVERGNTYDLFI